MNVQFVYKLISYFFHRLSFHNWKQCLVNESKSSVMIEVLIDLRQRERVRLIAIVFLIE